MQMTKRDAAVDRLVDRVGRERGRDEDDRGIRLRLRDRLGDGVEDRHAVRPACPPPPGVTPATTFVPYSTICVVWKRAFAPGDALDEQARVFVDENAHADDSLLARQRAYAR